MFVTNPREIEAKILNLARYFPERLPPCMVSQRFRCGRCELGDRSSCILLMDVDFLSLLRWKILNLSGLPENDISDDLVVDLVEVFESQGSALHVDKVLSLLLRQKPQQKINLSQLKNTLRNNPALFKENNVNVFTLNSDTTEENEVQSE